MTMRVVPRPEPRRKTYVVTCECGNVSSTSIEVALTREQAAAVEMVCSRLTKMANHWDTLTVKMEEK